jgi:hypothetical protein
VITPIVALLVLLLVAGAAVLVAMRRASQGYQDEAGFHLGVQGERVMVPSGAREDPPEEVSLANRNAVEIPVTRRTHRRGGRAAFHGV